MEKKKEIRAKVLELLRSYWGEVEPKEMEKACYGAISDLEDENVQE